VLAFLWQAIYWATNASAGYICRACPNGGDCEGELELPHARNGYWSPPRNTSRTMENAVVYESSFLVCGAFTNGINCLGGSAREISAACEKGYDGDAWYAPLGR
jgi:hypothetical protein